MKIELYKGRFKKALLDMNKDEALQLARKILSTCPLQDFVGYVLVDVLEDIGIRWEQGTVSLAQIYICGKICEQIVDEIIPPGHGLKSYKQRIAIATLLDYHSLGKRLVASFLKASGYTFIDYGCGIDEETIIEKVQQDKIDILLISTFLYPTALKVKSIRDSLDKAGYKIRILVGGAPFRFDKSLWRQVGADAMGGCASDAVSIINIWVEEGNQDD